MADDKMGDAINPYDLGHVADVRSGRRKIGRRIDYPQTPEIAVTRAALDASTEAGRVVILLIAENAKLNAENTELRAEVAALRARYEAHGRMPLVVGVAMLERLRDDEEER